MKYKVILSILMIILIIAGSLFCYGESNVFENENKIQTDNRSENKPQINDEKEAINQENQQQKAEENIFNENKITNILLLGIDKQENASDTIIIFSINEKNKSLKVISIMRDMYIYQGEGMANKINYAYHYGGFQGSIKTINEKFNLDISKFIKVEFDDLVKIVDYLDGINLKISEAERMYINNACNDSILINSGDVNLNGEQALAYSRIRRIDSDFQRTQRQRDIIFAIVNKIKESSLIRYPKILETFASSIQTNLSTTEFLGFGKTVISYDDRNLSQLRLPIDGTWSDNTNGVYHLDWQEEVNKKALHDFIYN